MKVFNKPVIFLKEVRTELGKVSWSDRPELIGSTIVVIVITVLMAAYIGIVDLILSKGLSLLFNK